MQPREGMHKTGATVGHPAGGQATGQYVAGHGRAPHGARESQPRRREQGCRGQRHTKRPSMGQMARGLQHLAYRTSVRAPFLWALDKAEISDVFFLKKMYIECELFPMHPTLSILKCRSKI